MSAVPPIPPTAHPFSRRSREDGYAPAKGLANALGRHRRAAAPRGGPPSAAPQFGFAFSLEPDRAAAGAARRVLLAADGALPRAIREDVLLLTTELVTNSVKHADSTADAELRVQVRVWPRRLRVEVTDRGPGFTPAREASRPDGSGGRGLLLVDKIADAWGVDPSASGTCVWFEIRLAA